MQTLARHFQDVQTMREIIILAKIEQAKREVKHMPTEGKVHAQLAYAYKKLYKLYLDPRKQGKEVSYPFLIRFYTKEDVIHKFTQAAKKLEEELEILENYCPDESWIYIEQAELYRELEEPLLEMKAYQKALERDKHNLEILFHLGRVCFLNGNKAEGLKIYEILKRMQSSRAEELIGWY